ncbi:anthranilate synthase component I family protein [Zavarzinia sp. CC-PAN008]|uniref:anthranilate synthase component I family protein n=1 Tax=Zavarzinia sp. CC-PAN008 TaxID=3243332 RepID=UPI003F745C05
MRPLAWREPLAAFAAVAGEAHAVLLDSAAPWDGQSGDARSRWSYVACRPARVIRADDWGVTVDGVAVAGDPFAVLERELAAWALPGATGPAPFLTGAIGYLGYDLGRHLERLPPPADDPVTVPEMVVGLYDAVAAFDGATRQAWVIARALPGEPVAAAEAKAAALARPLEAAPAASPGADWAATSPWHADLAPAEVEARIARVIAEIHAGEIFQANFTQRFRAPIPPGLTPLDLYLRLRTLSPAPFAALLQCGPGLAIASASPERFLRLTPDGAIETRPIKGTRPRGVDEATDAALAAELLASEKDRAENLMIVDLLRNDLGRVAELGSVTVPQLNALERFASVHHLVSVVRAQLRRGLGPVDLLRATFPGGSITGAPKIRAMEIIRAVEPARRGANYGAIAWIGVDGAMDSAVVIRTLTLAGGTVVAQAGGGIVSDSEPAAEREESLVKLRPLLRAVAGPAP